MLNEKMLKSTKQALADHLRRLLPTQEEQIEQDQTLKRELGLEFLESLILDALREARHPLNAGEISRRAGIPFDHETGSGAPYYEITRGLLLLLESKDDVERPDRRRWQITPQGAARE